MKFTLRIPAIGCLVLCSLGSTPPSTAQTRVLFDASHGENAGNADWIIDADAHDLNRPHFPCGPSDFENESHAQTSPTPDQSGVTAVTPETYWTGGLSAFAIDLVKLGYEVESLPVEGQITFGDGGNPQDLGLYEVLVLPEPNQPFTGPEILAIRNFVAAGGGLMMIANHQTSDRDCDGSDGPHIANDLMGVVISGGAISDYGLFGIAFNVTEIAGLGAADYWFDDPVDDNVSTDPTDPIIHGPHGSGTGGLGLFGATAMTTDPGTNPTVRGHVWKTDAGGQAHTRVTFATATHMAGRIACIGDSSPADDGTGDPDDSLHFGWDQAGGGVNNREIHLNAVAWLAGPDSTAPAILAGPTVESFDCSATITWSTDEPADGTVEHGPTAAYGSSRFEPALTVSHRVTLDALSPGSLSHFRVGSADGSGNGPTWSADATFVTTGATPPTIVDGPTVVDIGAQTATVVWSTDEPTDGRVRFGPNPAYGDDVANSALTAEHAITLTGLGPATTYHYRVESLDACGLGPAASGDATFTTAAAQINVSGWTLQQFESSQSYVFPPGTTIPGGGYLVLARDADQVAFESEWGPLPAGTVYLGSAATFPFVNGGESFELRDDTATQVDGITVSMSAGTTIQRNNPGDPAGDAASWTVAGSVAGSPGSGAGTASAAGVVINEASDASDFRNEFVELYYDAAPAGADTTPPAAVVDLGAQPRSDAEIRLLWTAPGDDGSAGTAASYDIRHAPRPILTEADFAGATALTGEPAPQPAGTAEQWDAAGLDPGTPYYFALKSVDDSANVSALSTSPGGTTGPPGSVIDDGVADHPVLSEIQVRGVTDHDDEFIEIHNPTGSPVDLTGWSLQYKSAGGSSFLRFDLPPVVIPTGGYFLATRPAGEYTGSVTGDAVYTDFLMSASGGHLFLVDDDGDLPACTHTSVVDAIGYGTGDCPEGTAAAAPAAGGSLERAPGLTDPSCGNGIDTDDNGADFATRGISDPQNSAMSEPACRDLGNVGPSLFFGGPNRDALQWSAALGAEDYKIRRATIGDFMVSWPPPDDTHLLIQTSGTSLEDPAAPPATSVHYYFVNATNGAGNESPN